MNKKRGALKFLLPLLIILLVAMIVVPLKAPEWHKETDTEQTWESALGFLFAFLINMIPLIGIAILGAIFIIITIAFFVARNKNGSVIAALVVLCLLLPCVLFSLVMDISAFSNYIEVPIVAVVTFIVNFITFVVCCADINDTRKRKNIRPPRYENYYY